MAIRCRRLACFLSALLGFAVSIAWATGSSLPHHCTSEDPSEWHELSAERRANEWTGGFATGAKYPSIVDLLPSWFVDYEWYNRPVKDEETGGTKNVFKRREITKKASGKERKESKNEKKNGSSPLSFLRRLPKVFNKRQSTGYLGDPGYDAAIVGSLTRPHRRGSVWTDTAKLPSVDDIKTAIDEFFSEEKSDVCRHFFEKLKRAPTSNDKEAKETLAKFTEFYPGIKLKEIHSAKELELHLFREMLVREKDYISREHNKERLKKKHPAADKKLEPERAKA